MNISHLEPLLRQYGVDDELIEELRTTAAALPSDFGDGNLSGLVLVEGLTEAESCALVSRILRKVGPTLGVKFSRPSLLDMFGFPQLEELIAKAEGSPALRNHTEFADW